MTKSEYNRRYYLKNRERLKEDARSYRRENRDKVIAFERARYPARREAMLAHHAKKYRENPEQRKAYNRAYWLANKPALRIKKREFSRKNRGAVNAANRAYQLAHPDRVRAYQKRWNAKNKGAVRFYDARRRAAEKAVHYDPDSVKFFFNMIDSQETLTCSYCGKRLRRNEVHVDHVVPVSRGGAHSFDNFAVSCGHCNQSKSDKLLSEWFSNFGTARLERVAINMI